MNVRTRNAVGHTLIALTLMAGVAGAASGTVVGMAAGSAVFLLGLAMWLVRTWARGTELGAAQRYAQTVVPAMAVALVVPTLVMATGSGMGTADFNAAYTRLEGWATGDLGRVIAVGLLTVGIASGIVRQSIMAAVPAAGAGLALSLGPGIITTIFGATI